MLVLCIRGHPPPCSSHLFRLTCHMGAVRSPHARPPGLRDPTGLAASAHCSVPSWGLLLQIPRQHLHQEVILSLEGHLLSRLRGGRGRPDHGRHGLGHRLGRRGLGREGVGLRGRRKEGLSWWREECRHPSHLCMLLLLLLLLLHLQHTVDAHARRCADEATERTRDVFCHSKDAHATRSMITDHRLSQLAARFAL